MAPYPGGRPLGCRLLRPLDPLFAATTPSGAKQKDASHVERLKFALRPSCMLTNFKQVFSNLKEEGPAFQLIVRTVRVKAQTVSEGGVPCSPPLLPSEG